jgi:hypothetical protein
MPVDMPAYSDRTPNQRTRLNFWRQALLMSLAVALLFVWRVGPASADDGAQGRLTLGSSESDPGAIVMLWSGRVAAPMARQIRDAFEQRRHTGSRVVLKLSSGGGSVAEGERVIDVLRDIKRTHELETVVEQGRTCGSMCVFIYLQGQKRTAALSSLWLFHEVSHKDPRSQKVVSLDREAWEMLVNKYYGPAGVSAEWTAAMKPYTVRSDYWQTGADLINEKSGIVHVALGNQKERVVAEREPPRLQRNVERAQPRRDPDTPQRTGKPEPSSAECKIYLPTIGAMVNVACPAVSMR